MNIPTISEYLSGLQSSSSSAKAVADNYNWFDRKVDSTGYQQNINKASNLDALYHSAMNEEYNRQWLERMSNTSYQRAVEDLKKAGLNPYLAYSNGGASTPSASTSARSLSSSIGSDGFMSFLGGVVRTIGSVALASIVKK